MIFGCCAKIEYYDTIAKAGYDAITLGGEAIYSMDVEQFLETKEKINNGNLLFRSVNLFCPGSLRLNGDDYDGELLRKYSEKLFTRVAELGGRYIGIGAPSSRSIKEGYSKEKAREQFKDALKILCAIGSKYNIDVLLEPVCDLECNFITTTSEGYQLISELDLNNLFLVYDIYHAHMMKEPMQYLKDAAKKIRVVHIAQDHNMGERHYLDKDHMEEYSKYIQTLIAEGYEGELSLESFYGDIKKEAVQSLGILKSLVEGS